MAGAEEPTVTVPPPVWPQPAWVPVVAKRETAASGPTDGGIPLFIITFLVIVILLSLLIVTVAVRQYRRPLPEDVGEALSTMRGDSMFGGGR